MQAYVFPDKGLERHAGRFVWLSIDTERPENAGFLEKYPVDAWPSLFVLDPKDGSVAVRWLGGMTVPQLERLLDDGERAVKGGSSGADAALARADKLYGEDKKAEAITAYLDALKLGSPEWKNRPRTIESTLLAMATSDRNAECVELARKEVPGLQHSPSRANASAVGLGCALSLPKEDANRAPAIAALEPLVRQELAADTGPNGAHQMEADDISGLYDELVSTREDAGDEAGKKADAAKWAEYLEGEAAKAKTPEERTVFDSHRLGAYFALGQPERAIPMLEESEKALPNDYNPPARLAATYKQMGKYDDALAANDRALKLVYGPRKLRVLQSRADILQAKGDVAGEKKALQDALAAHDALPKAQQNPKLRERIQKSLDALGAAAPGSAPAKK